MRPFFPEGDNDIVTFLLNSVSPKEEHAAEEDES